MTYALTVLASRALVIGLLATDLAIRIPRHVGVVHGLEDPLVPRQSNGSGSRFRRRLVWHRGCAAGRGYVHARVEDARDSRRRVHRPRNPRRPSTPGRRHPAAVATPSRGHGDRLSPAAGRVGLDPIARPVRGGVRRRLQLHARDQRNLGAACGCNWRGAGPCRQLGERIDCGLPRRHRRCHSACPSTAQHPYRPSVPWRRGQLLLRGLDRNLIDRPDWSLGARCTHAAHPAPRRGHRLAPSTACAAWREIQRGAP